MNLVPNELCSLLCSDGLYAVLILPWGDRGPAGWHSRLGDTGLLKNPPLCYRICEHCKEIEGWTPGFEDGGQHVNEREFPVRLFRGRNRIHVCWARARDLVQFPFDSPESVVDYDRVVEHYEGIRGRGAFEDLIRDMRSREGSTEDLRTPPRPATLSLAGVESPLLLSLGEPGSDEPEGSPRSSPHISGIPSTPTGENASQPYRSDTVDSNAPGKRESQNIETKDLNLVGAALNNVLTSDAPDADDNGHDNFFEHCPAPVSDAVQRVPVSALHNMARPTGEKKPVSDTGLDSNTYNMETEDPDVDLPGKPSAAPKIWDRRLRKTPADPVTYGKPPSRRARHSGATRSDAGETNTSMDGYDDRGDGELAGESGSRVSGPDESYTLMRAASSDGRMDVVYPCEHGDTRTSRDEAGDMPGDQDIESGDGSRYKNWPERSWMNRQCPSCDKIYSWRMFQPHYFAHGNYRCVKCKMAFKTSIDLERHKFEVEGNSTNCPKCNCPCGSKGQAWEHCYSNLQCPFESCQKRFENHTGRSRHYLREHAQLYCDKKGCFIPIEDPLLLPMHDCMKAVETASGPPMEPFTCIFSFAGCRKSPAKMKLWKRHIMRHFKNNRPQDCPCHKCKIFLVGPDSFSTWLQHLVGHWVRKESVETPHWLIQYAKDHAGEHEMVGSIGLLSDENLPSPGVRGPEDERQISCTPGFALDPEQASGELDDVEDTNGLREAGSHIGRSDPGRGEQVGGADHVLRNLSGLAKDARSKDSEYNGAVDHPEVCRHDEPGEHCSPGSQLLEQSEGLSGNAEQAISRYSSLSEQHLKPFRCGIGNCDNRFFEKRRRDSHEESGKHLFPCWLDSCRLALGIRQLAKHMHTQHQEEITTDDLRVKFLLPRRHRPQKSSQTVSNSTNERQNVEDQILEEHTSQDYALNDPASTIQDIESSDDDEYSDLNDLRLRTLSAAIERIILDWFNITVDHPCGAANCGERFGSEEQLKQHIQKRHIQNHCSICGKSMNGRTKSSISLHYQRHEKTSKYACVLCPRMYPTPERRAIHEKFVHTKVSCPEDECSDCRPCHAVAFLDRVLRHLAMCLYPGCGYYVSDAEKAELENHILSKHVEQGDKDGPGNEEFFHSWRICLKVG